MNVTKRVWTRKGTVTQNHFMPDSPRWHCVCGKLKEDKSKRYCNACGEKHSMKTRVAHLFRLKAGAPAPEHIAELVAVHFSKSFEQLKSRNRRQQFITPRFLAIALVREKTGMTFTAIGKMFDRHHADIMHACESVKNRLETDQSFKRTHEFLSKKITHENFDSKTNPET